MDGPAALGRDAAELTVWIHGVWVPDHLEQREVVARVAVGGAFVEVEGLAFGERTDGVGFGCSVEDLTDEASGPFAVFDLGDRAQRAT
jgi:hypothetical protein